MGRLPCSRQAAKDAKDATIKLATDAGNKVADV